MTPIIGKVSENSMLAGPFVTVATNRQVPTTVCLSVAGNKAMLGIFYAAEYPTTHAKQHVSVMR
ncbi:hypothetical protein [Pseudomonas defluvii]|uniref:hypothetical protein n=1 Tax=Pseudomonas defluvii TaxID=1876757 RepID=UPI000F799251|nr:hypothetical protein [Pseudomonas defluvii]